MRYLLFAVFGILISIIDCKTFRIPNFILLLYFFLMLIFDFPISFSYIYDRLFAVLICFSIFLLIYHYSNGLGFGDVKYAALLGYILGFEKTAFAFLFTAISALLIYFIGLKVCRWEKTAKLPFAPFLTFGAFMAELIIGFYGAGRV